MRIIFVILAMLALPFFAFGFLFYVLIAFPIISGWEAGEEVVEKYAPGTDR